MADCLSMPDGGGLAQPRVVGNGTSNTSRTPDDVPGPTGRRKQVSGELPTKPDFK